MGKDSPKAILKIKDRSFVHQQIEAGNIWGWCSTHVTAKWEDAEGNEWTGDDYLGGCSYHSRKDFMQPDGYYDDMKTEAYDELVKKLLQGRLPRLIYGHREHTPLLKVRLCQP